MDNDEAFKKKEPSHFVENLSPEDAAELERLGHHGIGDLLNRDHEEDLSLQHRIETSPIYQSYHTHGNAPVLPGSSRNDTSFVHPIASLCLAITILIAGISVCAMAFQKPIDRQPAQVQEWPLAIGNVVAQEYHDGRTPTWDHTVEYQAADKTFWFEEKGDETNYHQTQIKYDPVLPSHFYRIQLEGETVMGQIIGCIVVIVGLCFGWDAALNLRRNDGRPINVGTTIFAFFCAAIFATAEVALYLNGLYSHGQVYRVASSKKPIEN